MYGSAVFVIYHLIQNFFTGCVQNYFFETGERISAKENRKKNFYVS